MSILDNLDPNFVLSLLLRNPLHSRRYCRLELTDRTGHLHQLQFDHHSVTSGHYRIHYWLHIRRRRIQQVEHCERHMVEQVIEVVSWKSSYFDEPIMRSEIQGQDGIANRKACFELRTSAWQQ